MLRLDHVTKTYSDGTRALANISLDVAPGEVLALLGASGCGKTTLLRVIAGLETATSGSIRLADADIVAPHAAIGLVFQEPRLLPWLNVAENVAFGLTSAQRQKRETAVAALLEKVGLRQQAAKLPRDLSGGQQQRAALARALVTKPSVLLLDEPFAALDVVTREDLQRHLLELWSEYGPTIIIVTHDVDEAVALADRVAILEPHPGRIADVVVNTVPRPRDRESLDFIALRRRLRFRLDALGSTQGFVAPANQTV